MLLDYYYTFSYYIFFFFILIFPLHTLACTLINAEKKIKVLIERKGKNRVQQNSDQPWVNGHCAVPIHGTYFVQLVTKMSH